MTVTAEQEITAANAADTTAIAPKEAPKMSGTLDTIIQSIEKLTVLELSELVKALEDKFGVSAAAPMAMAMPMAGAGAGAAAVEEKTEFDAVLTGVGEKKIQVIKVIRELTGLGLKESKDIVDGAPKPIKTGIPEAEANQIKQKLEEVGATVEVK